MTHYPAARLSIIAYKPKPGKEAELRALTDQHVPFLRSAGLATERPHIIATAADGTLIEVFEWTEGGLERAHQTPALMELWQRYSMACDFVPLNSLPETGEMFANFTPL